MENNTVIFLGPTLQHNEALAILDAIYLPPAAQGDMITAYERFLPSVIGLIDGYFECRPSVWHKEILYLMCKGVHIFGSSSMGALRAAELNAFGMVGIGEVFYSYNAGIIEDDDEVAIVHGPESLGYPMLSEAMVNIRRTLQDARSEGIISSACYNRLLDTAKHLHYKTRTYANIFNSLSDGESSEIKNLRSWLATGRRDLKKEDALSMLEFINEFLATGPEPKEVKYRFQNTSMWVGLMNALSESKPIKDEENA
jgi:hypothetical protein